MREPVTTTSSSDSWLCAGCVAPAPRIAETADASAVILVRLPACSCIFAMTESPPNGVLFGRTVARRAYLMPIRPAHHLTK